MTASSLFGHCHCRSYFSRLPPASPDLASVSIITRPPTVQTGMRKRRPAMLRIISHARTSGVMLTPGQLRSNSADKSP
jgi:hypothetical protein